MGRYLSSASASALAVVAGEGYLLPGQLPAFGTGRFEVFTLPTVTVTIKPGVKQIRVRVAGGGGGATAAGATSFGDLISATGGAAPNGLVPGDGGIGIGGDYQAAGGKGGAGKGGGGGAAGSEMGKGGDGGAGGLTGAGGGAVGAMIGGAAAATTSTRGPGGASAFGPGQPSPSRRGGPDMTGQSVGGAVNLSGIALPHALFAFTGAGGGPMSAFNDNIDAGPGAGGAGSGSGGNGTNNQSPGKGGACGGGGGAGGGGTATEPSQGGLGGAVWPATFINRYTINDWPDRYIGPMRIGGGRGGNHIDTGKAGAGGGGYARGVFAVVPGQQFPVTVAQQDDADGKSGGMVILEY
jgi:hypothetical protein